MKKYFVIIVFLFIGLVASAQSSTDATTATTTKVVWSGSNATKEKVVLSVGEVTAKRGLTTTGGTYTEKDFSAPIYQDSKGKFFYWKKNKAGVWALTSIKK